jgi:hypothetical protein
MEGTMSNSQSINTAYNSSTGAAAYWKDRPPQNQGQALYQQVIQSHQRELLIQRRFEQFSGRQTKLADEFVSAAGRDGINTLAETPDGQQALRSIYEYAGKDSREFMQNVHHEQGTTAIDYTHSRPRCELGSLPQHIAMIAPDRIGGTTTANRPEMTFFDSDKNRPDAIEVIGDELPKWIDEAGRSIKRDFSDLGQSISESKQKHNDFYEGLKDNAVESENLPKYMIASIAQSAGNLGYHVSSFAANLIGNEEKAAQQWSEFKEYSLETSEGTNAIEVELSPGLNYFGLQVGFGVAIGVDNQGRVDVAVSGNYEPNTDVLGVEALAGINVAKAWHVKSVVDLINGSSTALEGFISGQEILGGELSYGQGYLHTEDGDIAFAQMGGAVTIEDPVESPVWGGLSADVEQATSASQLISDGTGFEMGWAGKALYGLLNVSFGNGLDELTLQKGKR